jgi:hypothetical protein
LFYLNFDKALRKYFLFLWLKNSFSFTLKEIRYSKLIKNNKKLIKLFEDVYFYKFSKKPSSLDIKQKMISDFLKII